MEITRWGQSSILRLVLLPLLLSIIATTIRQQILRFFHTLEMILLTSPNSHTGTALSGPFSGSVFLIVWRNMGGKHRRP